MGRLHLVLVVLGGGLGDGGEGVLDIGVGLGAGFKVVEVAVVLAPLFSFHLTHLPLGLQVALVPEHDEGEAVLVLDGSLHQELLLPGFQGVETLAS